MKKISFIRWKGFIPFIIIAVLVYVIATFFLDHWLKKIIEKQGTYYNDALVEMKSLKLSFLNASLKIKELEITNPNNLMQDRVAVGDITLDFRFLPLLKKKFVVDEIKVTDVRWLTPRKSEGKIPESWKKEFEEDKKKPSVVTPIINQAMENLKKSVKAELPNISVDSLKKKFDPREAVKLEELTSYKKAFEVKDKAENFYKKWDEDSKKIVDEQKQFVSDIRNRVSGLNVNNISSPIEAIGKFNELRKMEELVKGQKQNLTGRISGATSEIKGLTGELAGVQDLIKNDVKSITDKYSFGSLSIDNLSKQIFGMQWIPYYQKYVHYSAQLKGYLDKYKSGNKEEAPKPKRFKGIDIAFPITDNTPTLLVQKVDLSAETGKKEAENEFYHGKYALKILDISSDQKLYGKPTTADLTLDTFGGPFAKADLNLLIDHRDDPTKDNIRLEIKKFKLAGQTLGEGSVFPLPIKNGFFDAKIGGGIIGEKAEFNISLDVKDAAYQFAKTENYLVGLMQDIVSKINQFKVEIAFAGTLEDPKLSIRSTLDDAIAAGIKKVFAEKLAEVKAKAEKYINEQISSNINQLKSKIASVEGGAGKLLGDQLKGMDFLSGDLKSKLDALAKNQNKQSIPTNVPQTKDVEKKLKGLFGK